MRKEIKNYFEVKEICRKATSYFIGSFIEYIIDRREEWENPQTKKIFIANFHKEFFDWDDECTFERTQNRVNCAIRLIEHHKVEEALEYVLNSNDKKMDIQEAKINAQETLDRLKSGELKY